MKLLDRFEEWFITFLIGAATLIIVASVIHRYLSGWPIPGQDFLLGLNFGWAQELCIIMFVWMAKFGAAYGCEPASTSAWTCSSTACPTATEAAS